MLWLLTRPIVLPIKTALFGTKVGYRTGRVVGYRRLLLLGIGVGIGVLVAPGPGADLRAKLKAKLEGGSSSGGSTGSTPMATWAQPARPVPAPVMDAGHDVVDAALQAPTPVATVPVPVDGSSASPSVPDDVLDAGQDVVDAALQAPTPLATVPVGGTPATDDGALTADAEGEPLPAVPDADAAVMDPPRPGGPGGAVV